jgi:hypothetical protein
MKAKGKFSILVIFVIGALLMMSCLLPGIIPLTPVPTVPAPVMETDAAKVIESLNSNNAILLEALAEEQYAEEDFAKPGRLTYTIRLTEERPTYFGYGWCTTTEEILQQNFEHIDVKLYFNDDQLGEDVVHPVTFTRSDGLVCVQYVVLMSNWPNGEYDLEAIATFDEQINDGLADYAAGDYAFVYNVTVEK